MELIQTNSQFRIWNHDGMAFFTPRNFNEKDQYCGCYIDNLGHLQTVATTSIYGEHIKKAFESIK